jgi:hypothetical protein
MSSEQEKPDELVLDTLVDLVEGKATVADVRAAMELALECSDLSDEGRKVLTHAKDCPNCIPRLARETAEDLFISRIAASFGARVVKIGVVNLGRPSPDALACAPTKGVH